jgi:hypothetical protein
MYNVEKSGDSHESPELEKKHANAAGKVEKQPRIA